MAVVVATRIKTRRARYIPRFMRASMGIARQARHSRGFLGGRLRAEPRGAYWTITVWESGRDMVAFRDAGLHAVVSPRIGEWAAEAVFGVWNSESKSVPSWREASSQLAEHPNFAVLEHATQLHRKGQVTKARRLGFDLPIPASRHSSHAKPMVSRVDQTT